MLMNKSESQYLSYTRSISIVMIVFGHVGGGWFFKPWSEFIAVFVALFFFISGAVLFHSFKRSQSIIAYWKKRLVRLLVPYYLLCIFSLFVYIFINYKLPDFDFLKLLAWLEIRPHYRTTPFNIGQVWFLHTLAIITIISPFYFMLIIRRKTIPIIMIVLTILILSAIQLEYDIHRYFHIIDNNFYKPIIHSLFFILGAVYFSHQYVFPDKILVVTIFLTLLFSLLLVTILHLEIGYGSHTFSPDIYYVSGSVAVISLSLLLRKVIPKIINNQILLKNISDVIFKYTMPIFLLHSFSIFFLEEFFGLAHPKSNIIIYGIVKFILVIIITVTISPLFYNISNTTVNLLLMHKPRSKGTPFREKTYRN